MVEINFVWNDNILATKSQDIHIKDLCSDPNNLIKLLIALYWRLKINSQQIDWVNGPPNEHRFLWVRKAVNLDYVWMVKTSFFYFWYYNHHRIFHKDISLLPLGQIGPVPVPTHLCRSPSSAPSLCNSALFLPHNHMIHYKHRHIASRLVTPKTPSIATIISYLEMRLPHITFCGLTPETPCFLERPSTLTVALPNSEAVMMKAIR